MNEESLKRFVGSDLQAEMVKNIRSRMAEFFEAFIIAKPEDLLALQAQAAAYYRMLREISLDADDLKRVSAETVEQMEVQRREQERGLEQLMRDRATRASISQ